VARPDPVKQELDKSGLKLLRGSRKRFIDRALDTDPSAKNHPWWYAYACARIGRILEGAKPSWGAFTGSSALESACKSAAHPKCARWFMETYSYFMTRHRPAPILKTDHNPFRNLSDRDAWGKWYTLVEKICDSSTGKLGTWRVGLSETGTARNR
jgi:hypothetical protein